MNRPVRIGILDTGVCRTHPHVGKIVDGITITADGAMGGYEDTLGHGTAVASVIHHLNPEADLIAVKIFDGKLATSLPVVIRAIDWCLGYGIQVINLSLGTLNPEHRSAFEEVVARAQAAGAVIVSALEMNGKAALPGSLAGVIGVMERSSDGLSIGSTIATESWSILPLPFHATFRGYPGSTTLRV